MLQHFAIAQPPFCRNARGGIAQKAVQLLPAVEFLHLPRMPTQMEHSAMKTHIIQHRLQAGHEIAPTPLKNVKQLLPPSPFATPDGIPDEHSESPSQYRRSRGG